ncbi:MAG: serine/threonine protein kinase [Myxococcales bacterium]|nr:serine/threonine protein kinase [Myxococcales bacterium]
MAMPSQPDDLIGRVVAGRYRVLGRLGQGGMGTVYLAEHEAIEKKVALKVLRAEYSAKPDLVERFQREAISASRIKHPNVLDVFDFGQLDNGCFFLAMEFLEGRDLADELESSRVLTPEHALRVVLQICKALAVAHGKGVVHRDLKPENVFLQLTADGEETVKIVDFGIAQLRSKEEAAATETSRRRLTRTGMIFGTPEYMSPEQAAGRHADLRVDIYATGIILYEMLTGAVPFTGDTFFAVLNSHMTDPLPPMRALCPDVTVSAELEGVIAKALAKKPEERFQSMRELAAALMTTPEAATLDPLARKSAIPGVSLADYDRARQTSESEISAEAKVHPLISRVDRGDGPAARADTLPVGLTRAEAPERPAGKGVWIALGLIVLAGGAVATLKLLPSPRATASVEPQATTPLPSTIVEPMQPAELIAPIPSAVAAPAGSVRLNVVSEPEGAVILKGGFQVCDKAPCEVLAAKNESLSLEAKKDKLRGTAKVLAQSDQTVTIKLTAPGNGKRAQPCYQEVIEGELKVMKPVPCK